MFGLSGCAGGSLVGFIALGTCVLTAGGLLVVYGPTLALQGSARAAVSALTAGEADFGWVSVHATGAEITGLTVTHPDGQQVLAVDRIVVGCDPAVFTEPVWALHHVRLEGLTLTLREEGDGVALPPATWAWIAGEGGSAGPRIEVGAVEVVDAGLRGVGRRSLDARLGGATARAVVLDPTDGLSFTGGEVTDVRSTVDGARLLDVERVILADDGRLDASGVVLAGTLAPSGLPVWPPLVELVVPDWAGGRAASAGGEPEPWWGLDPSAWPWVPAEVHVDGARLHLSDRFMAARPADWAIAVGSARLGPLRELDGGQLPLRVQAHAAGGSVSLTGGIRPDGRVTAHVDARGLAAAELDPYLAVDLGRWGVQIREGTVDAAVDVSLRGSQLRAAGDVALTRVRFTRTSAFSGLNKALLTTASWLVGGNDTTFTAPVEVVGDYRDPAFSPVRQLAGQISRAIVDDAGRRVEKGAGTVVDAAGRAWKGASGLFRKGEAEGTPADP